MVSHGLQVRSVALCTGSSDMAGVVQGDVLCSGLCSIEVVLQRTLSRVIDGIQFSTAAIIRLTS